MFSNSLKYLIKALSFLALHSDSTNKYGVKEISEKTKVPTPYLGKLLNTLSKKNIITSNKGPGGGFYLSDDNKKVKLGEVVFLIEGKEKYGSCLMGFENCNLENPCPLHHLFSSTMTEFLSKMKSISIGELADKRNDIFNK